MLVIELSWWILSTSSYCSSVTSETHSKKVKYLKREWMGLPENSLLTTHGTCVQRVKDIIRKATGVGVRQQILKRREMWATVIVPELGISSLSSFWDTDILMFQARPFHQLWEAQPTILIEGEQPNRSFLPARCEHYFVATYRRLWVQSSERWPPKVILSLSFNLHSLFTEILFQKKVFRWSFCCCFLGGFIF